jgi:Tol biopolymer transport system component
VLTARLDGAEQKQIEKIHDPAFSPDGAQVAYLKPTNDLGFQEGFFVSAADWTNENQVYAPKINESVDTYSWSPDGSRMVFSVLFCDPNCDISKYYLWSTSGTGLVELPAVAGQSLSAPIWSSNGQYILLNGYDQASGQHSYQAVNLETLALQPILEKFPLPEGGYIASIWVKP